MGRWSTARREDGSFRPGVFCTDRSDSCVRQSGFPLQISCTHRNQGHAMTRSLTSRSIPNRDAPRAGADWHVGAAENPPRQANMPAKENIMPKVERVIPVLTDQDIPTAHDFLVHAFGFDGG